MTDVKDWISRNWPRLVLALLSAAAGGAGHRYGFDPRRADHRPAPGHRAEPDAGPADDDHVAPPPRAKRAYGWTRPAAGDEPERVFAAPAGLADNLPAAVHLMSAPAPEVPAGLPFDQGPLGSCGPHSAAAAIMYADTRAGRHGLPPPSRLFIYYATRSLMGTVGQDSGVSNATMVKALARYGYCDESLWPYHVELFRVRPGAAALDQAAGRKVRDYSSVPQDLGQMKACLADGRPFVFGFTVYQSFESPQVESSGVVPMPRRRERTLGGHDVLIVGYDDRRQAFRFLNSWGAGWGDGGFGWMPYGYATDPQLAGDFWTVGSGR